MIPQQAAFAAFLSVAITFGKITAMLILLGCTHNG